MTALTRRRVLLLSLSAPLAAAFAGCDPNPNGPAFPTAPPAEKGEAEADADPKNPTAKKGRKKQPNRNMATDPAA